MKPVRPLAAVLAAAALAAAAQRPLSGPAAVADGVPLPEPAAADALAGKLAACGFGMVRLPDVSAPEDVARYDAFAAACAQRGLRLWGDALVPALAVAPAAEDVAAIDDPFTAAAWTNALAEAEKSGFDPFLAAPWDPRLEALLQRRVRDWARAFNPAAGRRRGEDPAWALVGFSSGWRNAFLFAAAPAAAPVPPAFFRDGFLAEWNAWLYRRHGTDEAAAEILRPGESVVSNAVAWIGSPFGPPPAEGDPPARLREERLFLQDLYLGHVRRLVFAFRNAGGLAADVPVFARWGEGSFLLQRVSDVRFAGAPEAGFPTIAFFPEDGGFEAFGEAAEADLLVFPCGGAPERFAPWARLFRTIRGGEGRLVVSPAGSGVSAPGATVRFRSFPAGDVPPETLRFPETGAALRLRRLEPGGDPDGLRPEPPEGNGLSAVVWLPGPENPDGETPAGGGPGGAAAEAGGTLRLEFAFAPDAPGAATSLFVRLRDAETGADVPFGLAVAGSVLRRREWRDLSPGAASGKRELPPDRVLRLPPAAGPRLLLFPPETFESEILKRLEAEEGAADGKGGAAR